MIRLKRITFSAPADLVERAHRRVRLENTTLDAAICEWLEQYSGDKTIVAEFRALMAELSYAKPGRKFAREEMNKQ